MSEVTKASQDGRKSTFLYIQAFIYVIMVYLVPFMVMGFDPGDDAPGIFVIISVIDKVLVFILPPIVVVMNIVAVLVSLKADRLDFLKCAMIIKYLLIPFFIIGGVFVAAAWTLIFIPVPGLNFVGPFIGIILTAVGYLGVVFASPFMIACLIKSVKQKVYHPGLAVAIGVAQFIFGTDVLSAAILSIKEKTWIKATIGAAVLIPVTIAGFILCSGML